MPLVIPKKKKTPHPDGKYAAQIKLINMKRNQYELTKNDNVNYIMKLQNHLNLPMYSNIIKYVSKLQINVENDNKLKMFSREWSDWINQQYLQYFVNDNNNNADGNGSIFICLKKPPNNIINKFKCYLIFNSNVDILNFNVEMICLNILLCTCFINVTNISIDKNIFFHKFIDYLKKTNNKLYLQYLKTVYGLNIFII